MASNAGYQRRIRLIKPRLQLKLVGAFVGLSALSLLLQYLLVAAHLSTTATEMTAGGEELVARMPSMLLEILALSFGLFLPLTFLLGIVITFRVAGPVYRFERHLDGIARGEPVGPCRIRTHDELHELCDSINAAIERIRRHGLPSESEEAAEEPSPAAASRAA